MSETTKKESAACCFLARHPDAAAIDAALAKEDPRAVARRFGIGKTAIYKHRGHIAPQVVDSASVPPIPRDSAEQEPPSRKTAERRTESSTRAQPQVLETTGGTGIPRNGGTAYETAVAACAEAITRGLMRPAVLQGIGQKYGLTRDRARHAYHEAARHLRLDMGGLLERQETSIAWLIRRRDDAQGKADARERIAEEWRQKERKAHDDAQRISDDRERIAALGDAARMGLVASKYGLEAEKWHAQALNHQKHLDDVQCLLGPKELHLTQNNFGGASDDVERFASALAARFADRPDVLAALEDAAADIEREEPGDGAAIVTTIVTTGEAA